MLLGCKDPNVKSRRRKIMTQIQPVSFRFSRFMSKSNNQKVKRYKMEPKNVIKYQDKSIK